MALIHLQPSTGAFVFSMLLEASMLAIGNRENHFRAELGAQK